MFTVNLQSQNKDLVIDLAQIGEAGSCRSLNDFRIHYEKYSNKTQKRNERNETKEPISGCRNVVVCLKFENVERNKCLSPYQKCYPK